MVTALIKALRNEVRGAEKGMPKHSPGAFQNLAQHVPDPSKIEAWGVPGNQNEPKKSSRPAKSVQEVPKSRPRSAQEGPRAAQGRPKAGQLTLKSRPKEAPTLLESIPASHETRFEQEFCGKLCSAGSRSDFMSFFGSCDKLAICKNLRKT